MDSSDQRRKRKNMLVTIISRPNLVSPTSLFLLCFSFLFLFYFFSSHNSFHLSFSTLSLLHASTPNYIYYPLFTPLPLKLQHAILFPDHVLLMLSNPHQTLLSHQLECMYYNNTMNGSSEVDIQPVLSMSQLDEFRSIVRCPLPEMNFFAVDLRHRDLHASQRKFGCLSNQTIVNYDKLAYEATLDGNNVVVFVKGMNLRPHKVTDPTSFQCHIGLNGAFWLTTKAVSVAQEVVRCLLPQSIIGSKNNTQLKVRGLRVTVSHMIGHVRHPVREVMPSVARVHHSCSKRNREEKYELCACTMVWNQARVLKEWVMYHAWLGVERWFIYDNNSDDDIDDLVRELNLKGFNISINTWPWIKTQEAGFSHCALKSKEECKWVAFFDIDEFFYFPRKFNNKNDGENSLRSMVANFSNSNSIAEIRTTCHSFGPSGLDSPPKRGVTVGYTCRLRNPERHKSIVRPDLLDNSLMNLIHHFQLRDKEGFKFRFMDEGDVVINHYKYQVWDIFKAKFYRRVATYVVDWKEDKTKGSKDRAPGLGTEAIEPPNWRLQFCEVWDNGLKDFLLSNFTNPDTGLMPWE